METVHVFFKKTHPNSVLPSRNHTTDAGLDVTCVEDTTIEPGGATVVPVGLSLSYITRNYWLMVACRSGLGFKHNLSVHPGIIDQDYRGDMGILMRNHGTTPYNFKAGDRCAQLIIVPHYGVIVGESEPIVTERGSQGFGSSGA